MAHCNYIADIIRASLLMHDPIRLFQTVSPVSGDLHEDGSSKSSEMKIVIADKYGKRYKVTVEEYVVREVPIVKQEKKGKKSGANKPV